MTAASAGDLGIRGRRGLESGLTRGQVTGTLTHLGFYAGWAKATKAIGVASRTLGKQELGLTPAR